MNARDSFITELTKPRYEQPNQEIHTPQDTTQNRLDPNVFSRRNADKFSVFIVVAPAANRNVNFN